MLFITLVLTGCVLFAHAHLRGDRDGDGDRDFPRPGVLLGTVSGYGGFGSRGFPGGLLDDLFDDVFVNSTCVNPETAPTCLAPNERPDAWNPPVDGVWVCRSLYHPLTGVLIANQSSCINPLRGLASDDCGCCGGVCPEACGCLCETRNGEEGVWVEFAPGGRRGIEKDDEEEPKQRCVPIDYAPAITAGTRAQCVTTCPVE